MSARITMRPLNALPVARDELTHASGQHGDLVACLVAADDDGVEVSPAHAAGFRTAGAASVTFRGLGRTPALGICTKDRRHVLNDEMLTRCEEIMRDVCQSFEAELREFNGEEDHVHLLVHYPPKVQLSKLVNSLKGVSSRYLRQEFTARTNPGDHARPVLVPVLLRRVLRRSTL